MNNSKRRPALTLIELLIVISILLILAGLAIENYTAASIRARVARAKSEHRLIMGAVEAYRVDHNAIPRMAHRKYDDPAFDYINGVPVSGVLSNVLSTPVAYISSTLLFDPFMEKAEAAPLDERLYTYQVIPVYMEWNPESEFWPKAREFYGEWRLGSVGPDLIFDHGFANSAQLLYDPTNGLISMGNLWSSNKNPEALPAIPDLLGHH